MHEGVLSRKQGAGTFVTPARAETDPVRLADFVEDISLAGIIASSRIIRMEQETPSPKIAAILGQSIKAAVMCLERWGWMRSCYIVARGFWSVIVLGEK